ncbi:MAG: hypothetical protein GY797_38475 [Deltaproteobacteria bacterium]|nr:hypothetical protein [Deltaproteobacteria bacterium]
MSEVVTPAFIAMLVFSFICLVGIGVVHSKKVQTKKISERTFFLTYVPLLMLPVGISATYMAWPGMNFIIRVLIAAPLAYLGALYAFAITVLFIRKM